MDFGIVNDFAEGIVTHLLTLVPKSVMPYEHVPAHHYDSLESCPSQLYFEIGNIGRVKEADRGRNVQEFWCRRPEQMLRNENTTDFRRTTKFDFLSPGPTGMIEVSCFPKVV